MQVLISIIILDKLKEHPKVSKSKQGEESELLGNSENLDDKTTLWLGAGPAMPVHPHNQLDLQYEQDNMR
jgi:hypothetical protein